MKLILVMLLFATLWSTKGHAADTITVDAKQRHQKIEGFGTCLISWGNYPKNYDDEMAKIYTKQMGCNILRINLWGDNHRTPTAKAENISYKQVDLNAPNARRTKIFLDFAKKAQKYDKDLLAIATVWSPPTWMKMNKQIKDKSSNAIQGNGYKLRRGGMAQNRVDPKYFPHFAKWCVEMMKLHEKEGVPLYALSPGNEVMFSQSFESCVWTAKDWATIIGMIGELKDKEGFKDVKLFGPETMTKHNWSIANPLYIKEILANPLARKHLDIWATHGYTDGVTADMGKQGPMQYWNLIKDTGKPYWMTEGGTGSHDWPAPLRGMAAAVHNSLVGGNASAFVPWQISENRKNTHALMYNKEMTKKSHCARHYFKFIDAGAYRVNTDSDYGKVMASAFHHKKKRKLTVILLNPKKEAASVTLKLKNIKAKRFTIIRTSASEDSKQISPISISSRQARIKIPAECIVTLVAQDAK